VAACDGGGGGTSDRVTSLGGAGSAISTTRTGASSDPTQAALELARCLRQHGINLADPQITAKGIRQQLPTDVDRDNPRLSAAEQACHQDGSLPND
jgi:hypothetical protein